MGTSGKDILPPGEVAPKGLRKVGLLGDSVVPSTSWVESCDSDLDLPPSREKKERKLPFFEGEVHSGCCCCCAPAGSSSRDDGDEGAMYDCLSIRSFCGLRIPAPDSRIVSCVVVVRVESSLSRSCPSRSEGIGEGVNSWERIWYLMYLCGRRYPSG